MSLGPYQRLERSSVGFLRAAMAISSTFSPGALYAAAAATCASLLARYIGAMALLRIAAFVVAAIAAPIAGHAAVAAADSKIDTEKAAAPDSKADAASPAVPDPERFFKSIFKVRTRAVPNARSSATLGQEREGTGVVIGDDGLVVTIGYLIVEADDVSLVDQQGHVLPARIVAYDHATGLGLVRPVVPVSVPPF